MLTELDSRACLGTDIERSRYPDAPDDVYVIYPARVVVRVILGEFGNVTRLSAPEIGIVAEGADYGAAWTAFLDEARKRDDAAWLTFDVGPTRREEIEKGLDAPEDEEWSEPCE